MQVVQVEFRRVRNLGNYETAELKLVAVPGEGEDFRKAIDDLKFEVLKGLGLEVKDAKKSVAETKGTVAEKPAGNDGSGTATPEPEKASAADTSKAVAPKPKGKGKATTPANDGAVGDVASGPAPTLVEVKAKMKQVVKEVSYDTAMAVLKKFNVGKTDDLSADQYVRVLEEAEKALAAKAGK